MPTAYPKLTVRIGWASVANVALASTSWTDVSDDVLEFSSSRGRQRELDRFEAGRGKVVLDNVERKYEAGYSGSPYYPNVLPWKRIQMMLGENGFSNPRFAVNTTGWTAANGTITRVTTDAVVPAMLSCGSFVCTGASVSTLRATYAAVNGTKRTLVAWVKGTAGHTYNLRALNAALAQVGQTPFTCSGGWDQVVLSYTPAETATHTLSLEEQSGSQNGTLLVGAVQVVDGDEQPYADGATPFFTGRLRELPIEWEGDYSTVSIDLVDEMEALALAGIGDLVAPSEGSGARVGRLLDVISYPAGERSIDTGAATMAAETYTDEAGTKVRQGLDDAQDAEFGALFVSGAGVLTFHSRTRRLTAPYTTSQVTFADIATPGSSYPYTSPIVPTIGVDQIVNQAAITRTGSSAQVTLDTSSRDNYGLRTYARTVKVSSDLLASDLSQAIVQRKKLPALRYDKIMLDVWLDEGGTSWPFFLWHALNREISDRVTVQRTPPAHGSGSSSMTANDEHIEKVEHAGVQGQWLTTSFQLSPVDPTTYLTLDHATLGLLDSGNVLGF